MKTEIYTLHLKTSDGIKAFDVEMKFDDNENDEFLMTLDGEKISLCGCAEAIFIQLSQMLKGRYEIHSCYTCKYGNFCPFGDLDNEIFCINDFETKGKEDLFMIYQTEDEAKKRRRTLFDVCEGFAPCNDDYFTYK